MKRFVATCLSLPLVFGSVVVAGQQTPRETAQASAQNVEASQPDGQTSHAATTKKEVNQHPKKHSTASARKVAERPEYRREYSQTSVEVINGDASREVVFQQEQPTTPLKNAPKAMKNVPAAPLKVEVVNGSSADTQYLYGNGQDEQIEAMLNKPVVVGVESGDTRTVGGNKHPLVMRVNSAGAGDAKAATNGGQPVTNRISPRPKRPAYQPDLQ